MDKPETVETRHRLWAEGNARIAEWFASDAYKKDKLTEDRARRAQERRSLLGKQRHAELISRKKGSTGPLLPLQHPIVPRSRKNVEAQHDAMMARLAEMAASEAGTEESDISELEEETEIEESSEV